MKAESEADRETGDNQLQKYLQYAGDDGKDSLGEKKHDKNERED